MDTYFFTSVKTGFFGPSFFDHVPLGSMAPGHADSGHRSGGGETKVEEKSQRSPELSDFFHRIFAVFF